ncbi:hypothetical protein HYH02_014370 [Chlamydomonas schloesseri]|uniref:Uncharacterized protein n=1 Tax=Chlamydomonas schloesseri TaxID=2026947 RepID=A0A835SMZ0_9CHLO|nr:hypothetical protein HYH02_014370 [Chlamydomonas schloesseri]|eukprot:KAG2428566.1 hypothetical protein HYH02_014370 [Chlamydomonas schloesseri]
MTVEGPFSEGPQEHILGPEPTSEQPDASAQPAVKEAPPTPSTGSDSEKKPHPIKRFALSAWDIICEHWFILALGFAIGFAKAVPDFGRNGGWIAAQWSIKYGAVIIIFFLSGCSLKTKALVTAATRLHLHLFIQCICLVLTPAIGYGISRGLARTSMNEDLVNGLVVAMTMPTTISTNVVFTKQSGGNEAAALINAVVGNIIGIFVSPGWLYLYLKRSGQASYSDVIVQMVITIIAPLIAGQLVQYFVPDYVKKAQEYINFGKVGNVMIVLLVWNTFCNTFHKNIQLGAGSWVPMLFLEIGLFLFFVVLCLALATFVPAKRLFNMDKPDAVAVVMCGSTKTLALGMPLISVLFGKSANAGILSLPLLIYHATQCLLGSIMIKHLKAWVNGPRPGAWPASCWHPPPASEAAAVAAAGGPAVPEGATAVTVKPPPPAASTDAASTDDGESSGATPLVQGQGQGHATNGAGGNGVGTGGTDEEHGPGAVAR